MQAAMPDLLPLRVEEPYGANGAVGRQSYCPSADVCLGGVASDVKITASSQQGAQGRTTAELWTIEAMKFV